MNKRTKSIINLIGFMVVALCINTSCIKDELPNIEVDITSVTSEEAGFVKSIINENSVTVFVDTLQSKLNNFNLIIEISEGATISPNPSSVRDYTSTKTYTITSEDKAWVKAWDIDIKIVSENFPTEYKFNDWYNPANTAYMHPYEIVEEGGKKQDMYVWTSTNSSMSIVLGYIYGQSLNYTHFGTAPSDNAVDGKSVKLETLNISYISPTQPFVPGCVYVGEFDAQVASTDPLAATHFGVPFNKKPVSFKCTFNYQPKTIISTGKTDKGLLEAVLFKVDEDVPYLNGYTIKDKSFKNIVAYAEINPDKNTNGWSTVTIPFTYTQEINEEDLKNWKYGLAIYLSSSLDGDQYIGAGGTTLYVDYANVICE